MVEGVLVLHREGLVLERMRSQLGTRSAHSGAIALVLLSVVGLLLRHLLLPLLGALAVEQVLVARMLVVGLLAVHSLPLPLLLKWRAGGLLRWDMVVGS